MNTHIIKYDKQALLIKWLLFLSAVFIVMNIMTLTNIALAQERTEASSVRQFSARTGQITSDALVFINNSEHGNAIEELTHALSFGGINAYEKSTLYQMRGMSHYELGNMEHAARDLEKAISASGLLPGEISALRVNIAQLHISDGHYARGAQMLEDWEAGGGKLKPRHVELLYQAWVQAENYERALPWAEKWFNGASPKERKYYDVLIFLYNSLGLEGRRADLIKKMISVWPHDVDLWKTWTLLLSKNGRGEEAFELQKILYLGGKATEEKDIIALVYAYERYGMPYQAAQLLEREMNTGRVNNETERHDFLNRLWGKAREYKKALSAMESKAQLSEQAIDYYRLGEAYMENLQCAKAENLISKNTFKNLKPPVKNNVQYHTLLGVCYHQLSQKAPEINCYSELKRQRRFKLLNKSAKSFGKLTQLRGSMPLDKNNQWLIFVNGELRNYEDRDRYCDFHNDRANLCYIAIRLEYDELFLTGKFELEDKKCMKYKPYYDRLYRTTIK